MLSDSFEKLGELLLKESHISELQLKEALDKQRTDKGKIGEILTTSGAVAEEVMISVLSEQISIPCVHLAQLAGADTDLVTLIPEPFAREHIVVPVKKEGDVVEVAMADPENVVIIDNLENLLNCRVDPQLSGKEMILKTIDRLYSNIKNSGDVDNVMDDIEYEIDDESTTNDIDLSDEAMAESDAPIVKLVNIILSTAVNNRTTDVHIEPGNNNVVVRNRIDGALKEVMTAPIKSHNGIVARIKVMSKLNIAETRLPQDGRLSIKMKDRVVDVRVSILPSVTGEKIVLRLLDKSSFKMDLSNLGFDGHDIDIFRKCINHPYGLIIISGPTGSGKSTTLYAALNEIKSSEDNIVTVEDPVEYQMEGITQVATNEKINLTFASALRSILRQDPDKVLIGEIRDKETADIAMKVALTGHLVFTTLHSNDAPSTITRLIDIGVAPFLAGSSVVLVMAQRLIRKVCPECKEVYNPTDLEYDLLGIDKSQNTHTFYEGKGCSHCQQTGYYGRTGIFELMPVTSDLRKIIMENGDQEEIRNIASKHNMKTMRQAALEKLFSGETTVHEVLKRTVEEL